jgi:hypothetical protein
MMPQKSEPHLSNAGQPGTDEIMAEQKELGARFKWRGRTGDRRSD